MNAPIGYAWLQQHLQAPDFLGEQRARLAPVQRLERLPGGTLLVPARLAPAPDALAHALFAIKHEGVRLDYLAAALRHHRHRGPGPRPGPALGRSRPSLPRRRDLVA